MADVLYPYPGQPFVQVWPIINRKWTTGLWYTQSIGSGVWPPENDEWEPYPGTPPGKEQWHWYADNLNLDRNYINFYETEPEWFAISDEWGGISLHSNWSAGTWNPALGDYMYSPGWVHYEIPPVQARQIARAELVIHLAAAYNGPAAETAQDDLPFIAQIRNDITDYLGTYSPRHVLPIDDTGLAQIQAGGRVGVHFGWAGESPPVGNNQLFIECDYGTWDANDPLLGGDPLQAGAYIPHLRLWLASDVSFAGEATIAIAAQGALQRPQAAVTNHLARLRRDQR